MNPSIDVVQALSMQDVALTNLMDDLAGIARQLASDAIDAATAGGGDPVIIADAQQSLDDGDALRAPPHPKSYHVFHARP